MLFELIRKYKKELVLTVLFSVLFFLSRLINLTIIPIFTDEAIYVRWAQIASYDPVWRFISLADGKQPLFVWITMVLIRIIKDPLVAGRLVSVFSGLGTMVGLFFLSKELFKDNRFGWLTALLYLFFPFALLYDRMALMDGLVGLFAIWSLLLQIKLIKNPRLDLALILGMVMGGSVLTKSSGAFNLYLLPFSILLFPWRDKNCIEKLRKWLVLILISVVEMQAIYAVLRLSPLFNMVSQKNATFIYPLSEWLTHPWRFFWGNLKGLWDWLTRYLTWPMTGLVVISGIIQQKFFKEKTLLLVWFAAPFLALALFGKVLYPRFILFMVLPLLPLVSLSLLKLHTVVKNNYLFGLIFLLLSFWWVKNDWFLLTDPYRASLPESEASQYLNHWPAGGGIKEAVEFFQMESKKGKLLVVTEGTFGLLPYGLEIYLWRNPEIEIRGIWPLPEKIPEELSEKAEEKSVFFVFNQTPNPSKDWPLKPVVRYQKGIGDVYLSIYQLAR